MFNEYFNLVFIYENTTTLIRLIKTIKNTLSFISCLISNNFFPVFLFIIHLLYSKKEQTSLPMFYSVNTFKTCIIYFMMLYISLMTRSLTFSIHNKFMPIIFVREWKRRDSIITILYAYAIAWPTLLFILSLLLQWYTYLHVHAK